MNEVSTYPRQRCGSFIYKRNLLGKSMSVNEWMNEWTSLYHALNSDRVGLLQCNFHLKHISIFNVFIDSETEKGALDGTCAKNGSQLPLSDSYYMVTTYLRQEGKLVHRKLRGLEQVKVTVKVIVDLYSASSRTSLTHSDIDHKVLPANNTLSAFIHKHSTSGATNAYTHSDRLSST